jgi:hypothetical protein
MHLVVHFALNYSFRNRPAGNRSPVSPCKAEPDKYGCQGPGELRSTGTGEYRIAGREDKKAERTLETAV